jgi:hypothetical protein
MFDWHHLRHQLPGDRESFVQGSSVFFGSRSSEEFSLQPAKPIHGTMDLLPTLVPRFRYRYNHISMRIRLEFSFRIVFICRQRILQSPHFLDQAPTCHLRLAKWPAKSLQRRSKVFSVALVDTGLVVCVSNLFRLRPAASALHRLRACLRQ